MEKVMNTLTEEIQQLVLEKMRLNFIKNLEKFFVRLFELQQPQREELYAVFRNFRFDIFDVEESSVYGCSKRL